MERAKISAAKGEIMDQVARALELSAVNASQNGSRFGLGPDQFLPDARQLVNQFIEHNKIPMDVISVHHASI